MSLKINIHQIKENKSGQVHGRFIIDPSELSLPLPKENWRTLTFDFTCTNGGELYILTGTLVSQISQQCCRCLAPIEVPIEVIVQEHYCRNCSPTEDFHSFYGDEIPISEELRENVLLNLPLKPLCSSGCKGLCPQCGANLNKHLCDCQTVDLDPRLAVLKKLMNKQEVFTDGGPQTKNI